MNADANTLFGQLIVQNLELQENIETKTALKKQCRLRLSPIIRKIVADWLSMELAEQGNPIPILKMKLLKGDKKRHN